MPRGVMKVYRERSCTGKREHTREEAEAEAARLRREGEVCHAYRCCFCPAWHIGHRHRRGRGR